MADILPFRAPTAAKKPKKSTGKTLCKSGFHKWAVDQKQRFDVKQGRLVTLKRCQRCGYTRTTLS